MAITGAFCDLAEIEAHAQVGGWSSATRPTDTEVSGFAVGRAGELVSVMAGVIGTSAPGPPSYANPVDTSSDSGLALSALLVMANALAAAADALIAAGPQEVAGAGDRNAARPKEDKLMEQYADMIARIKEAVVRYASAVASQSGAVTHRSKGIAESGFVFTMETEW